MKLKNSFVFGSSCRKQYAVYCTKWKKFILCKVELLYKSHCDIWVKEVSLILLNILNLASIGFHHYILYCCPLCYILTAEDVLNHRNNFKIGFIGRTLDDTQFDENFSYRILYRNIHSFFHNFYALFQNLCGYRPIF